MDTTTASTTIRIERDRFNVSMLFLVLFLFLFLFFFVFRFEAFFLSLQEFFCSKKIKYKNKKSELTLAPIFLISYNIFNIYWHNI